MGASELSEDLKLFGLHEEAAAMTQQTPRCYELWPENETSFRVFAALETQWRVIAGMGFVSYQGLDYTSARDTLEMMGIPGNDWPSIFEDLRLMEKVAKDIFNEKDD
jgi:hypothetical protein